MDGIRKMPYIGRLRNEATCAICKKAIPERTLVYHDPTKSQGSHIVHTGCWEKLRAGRKKKKPTGSEKRSTEELDPPF